MTHKSIFRYIGSFFLCVNILVSSSSTWAKTRYAPTGIQLSVDALRLFSYKYHDAHQGPQYELNASIDFASWLLEGDWGCSHSQWKGTSAKSKYTSNGKYFRIGLNYNFLQDTPDKNMAFLGFRYAMSFFDDHLVSKILYHHDNAGNTVIIKTNDPIIDSKQTSVQARWFEMVAGIKVKVWKLLYVGSTLRYKFSLCLNGANSHVPYDVPGWGLNDEQGPFILNLYLSLRIPLVRNTLPSHISQKE